ncbi:hypothetical protein DB30_01893 [Enhygromyxa salina]|uniref:Tetratricopeptide repeat protein n=1 Tax=Enhygromyxa salina TaxID=215803 RepID=A0A0C1Z3F5_9BACT|nr:hypothetical protein [Enhygromyxa salina]KIG12129.1 hypothetical protein DB30_01893 [Enhygromyxa salina]
MRGGQPSAPARPRPGLAAVTLVATLSWSPLVSAAAPGPTADGASEDERKQAARAQVQAASAAFGAGDFALAIEHYEAAIALLPAPKLNYNLGVCHQRLSLSADTPEQRTRERDLAIESYNAYLEQNPRADDRFEVAATIRELGGTPVTMPTLMPLFEDDEYQPASDPQPDPQPDPQSTPSLDGDPAQAPTPTPAANPSPPQPPAPPYPHHGRFGFSIAGGYSPTIHAASGINGESAIALDLHGGGFVGPRRRFLLAAHTNLHSGAGTNRAGLQLSGYSFGLLGQQTWVVGHEALSLGLGSVVALTGQGLDIRPGSAPPACRTGNGTRVASRTGALVGPRLELGVLLGVRRRGMIGLLVQPGFAFFGDGRSGMGCEAGETPWTSLGVRRRWQLQLWAGAGFNFRF